MSIECACGCGKEVIGWNYKLQRPHMYIHGHNTIGWRFSKESGLNTYGENHPSWKGDNVGYIGLHIWVRKNKLKPELCELCKTKPARDISNISHTYKRNLDDWWYLCKSCHISYDCTDKTVEKRRLKMKGNKIHLGHKHSEESKKKMRDYALKNIKSRDPITGKFLNS